MDIGLNWLDFVILAILLFYTVEGYSVGFLGSLIDLVSFVLSFIVGLKYYFLLGSFLGNNFSIPSGISNAIGFFISAFVSEIIIGFILRNIVNKSKFLRELFTVFPPIKAANKLLGIILSIFSGLVLIAFILTLILSFPLSVFLKNSVSRSKIGNLLVTNTQGFEKQLSNIFGGAVNETLNFLTVEPKGNESVALRFKTNNIKVDSQAELKMFAMVNQEREKRGIAILVLDDGKLRNVARDHCVDMFERGYFSHYTPEGLSPFDRMTQADVAFVYAGENLALSPNVDLAMQGLMQSKGHRENILSPNFGRIGVGVIDGGIYGEMFCQEFTN